MCTCTVNTLAHAQRICVCGLISTKAPLRPHIHSTRALCVLLVLWLRACQAHHLYKLSAQCALCMSALQNHVPSTGHDLVFLAGVSWQSMERPVTDMSLQVDAAAQKLCLHLVSISLFRPDTNNISDISLTQFPRWRTSAVMEF